MILLHGAIEIGIFDDIIVFYLPCLLYPFHLSSHNQVEETVDRKPERRKQVRCTGCSEHGVTSWFLRTIEDLCVHPF